MNKAPNSSPLSLDSLNVSSITIKQYRTLYPLGIPHCFGERIESKWSYSCWYFKSFDKFNSFIVTSFSESKTWIKTLPFNIYNTGVILEIVGCFFKWVIAVIVQKIWNTWNSKLLDCFCEKEVLKHSQFTLSWDDFIFCSQIYFLFLENLFETERQWFPKIFGYQ